MASVITNQGGIMKRGGFAALSPAVGWIEKDITLGGVTDAANEAVEIVTLEDDTLVLACIVEVVTATTNSITASVGVGGGGGAATALCGEVDVSAAAGTKYSGGQGVANVLVAAGDAIEIEVSGDAGAAGAVRVKLLVADAEDLDGSA